MHFGWFNLSGFLIIALMMVPNIMFALNYRGTDGMKNKCSSKPVLIIEQVGRYGCMALMVLPLLVWEFSFRSTEEFALWAALCAAMLIAYYIFWGVYFRRQSLQAALWLAILPSAIFILRGVFLRHWLLVGFGVIFAVGHIYITWFNNQPEGEK